MLRRGESLAALTACAAVSLYLQRGLLRDDVLEGDALVHQYWMRGFSEPGLFDDPLTAELRRSERYPDAYEALFRLASNVADPIAFGEWLGIALMAVAGWLVFRIVREQAAWAPAAWIGAGLFLALDGHRFSGGFPRGFLHVVVLSVVLLAIRGRHLAAAAVAAGGVLVYPPAALLSIGVLAVSAVRLEGRRPRVDPRRGGLALSALGVAGLVLVAVGGSSGEVLTAAEARRFPDFGPNGPLHFFVPSTLEYLSQNRSGLDLRASSSILVLAAVAMLLVRPANLRLLRAEVLALPLVALGAFALAHAVLFRLYLPHRYTYPLVAFAAIAVAVALRPTWDAALARARRRPAAAGALLLGPLAVAALALFVFPLGPQWTLDDVSTPMLAAAAGVLVVAVAGAALVGRLPPGRAAAAGAVVTGLILGGTLVADDRPEPGQRCAETETTAFLASLPRDAVIAGDPIDLRCVVFTAKRAVVISTQLAPSYEREYFLRGRARMFDTLNAVYGADRAAIGALRDRYGVTHLWVRRDAIRDERSRTAQRWPGHKRPFGRYVRGLLNRAEPASLALPEGCERWSESAEAVYDVGCLAEVVNDRRTAGERAVTIP